MTEFAAIAASDAESVLVAWGVGDVVGLASLALLVAVGDFVGELVALAELLVPLGRALVPAMVLGTALTLRVLPPALADADGVVFVGVADGVAFGVADGVGVVPADGVGTLGKVVGGGGKGGLVGVGVGLGLLDVGVGDGDFKSSHCCWLAPITADVMRADTAVEALDAPSWSAEATRE